MMITEKQGFQNIIIETVARAVFSSFCIWLKERWIGAPVFIKERPYLHFLLHSNWYCAEFSLLTALNSTYACDHTKQSTNTRLQHRYAYWISIINIHRRLKMKNAQRSATVALTEIACIRNYWNVFSVLLFRFFFSWHFHFDSCSSNKREKMVFDFSLDSFRAKYNHLFTHTIWFVRNVACSWYVPCNRNLHIRRMSIWIIKFSKSYTLQPVAALTCGRIRAHLAA